MTRGELLVIRHGETEWSRSGRHTGLTDLALTDAGRASAKDLAPVLARIDLASVLASPLQRARETCELAGLGDRMVIDRDLVEWDYGDYEGLTFEEIDRRRPGWSLFADGCPGGESPIDVATRVDRALARVRRTSGHIAVFAHGHVLRVLAARWIGLPPALGGRLALDTATLSHLAYHRDVAVMRRWNVPFLERSPT